MITTRILQIISGIAGLAALTLGLLFWFTNIDLLSIHMLLGLTVALALLIMSILAVTTRGMRIWGIVGIIYAIIVPIFGLRQAFLLIGNLHWLIQVAHMLVGIGAMVLTGYMGTRYLALKRANPRPVAESQTAVHVK